MSVENRAATVKAVDLQPTADALFMICTVRNTAAYERQRRGSIKPNSGRSDAEQYPGWVWESTAKPIQELA